MYNPSWVSSECLGYSTGLPILAGWKSNVSWLSVNSKELFHLNFSAFIFCLASWSLTPWKHTLDPWEDLWGVACCFVFCVFFAICIAPSSLPHKFQMPRSLQLLVSLSSPWQNLSQSPLLLLRSGKASTQVARPITWPPIYAPFSQESQRVLSAINVWNSSSLCFVLLSDYL